VYTLHQECSFQPFPKVEITRVDPSSSFFWMSAICERKNKDSKPEAFLLSRQCCSLSKPTRLSWPSLTHSSGLPDATWPIHNCWILWLTNRYFVGSESPHSIRAPRSEYLKANIRTHMKKSGGMRNHKWDEMILKGVNFVFRLWSRYKWEWQLSIESREYSLNFRNNLESFTTRCGSDLPICSDFRVWKQASQAKWKLFLIELCGWSAVPQLI
jgi:hypothetical protein